MNFFIPLGIPRVAHWIISFMLHISLITSPTNWYLCRWVGWNISEVINENSTSAFNYLNDFGVKIWHKCDETSLTVTPIVVSLTLNPSCTKEGLGWRSNGFLNITLLRMNQNQTNFCWSKFDGQEIGGKLKKSNRPQNVGEREAQSWGIGRKIVSKCIICQFSTQILITEGKFWSKNM